MSTIRLGVIGGPEKAEEAYRALAERAGVELEYHAGALAGRGGATLDALIERSDYVVVITSVNSHAAVWRARRQAKRLGKRCILVNHFGVARMTGLIRDLEKELAPLARAAAR
jgi:hypothetical protein